MGYFILGILVFGLLGWGMYTHKLKKGFVDKYNIQQLPPQIAVRKNKSATGPCCFQLQYPAWTYPKKDGTADKRRNFNFILWGKSTLYLPDYIISSRRPYALIKLVKVLRLVNGLDIQMCEEEQRKFNWLYQQKSLLVSNLNLNNIVESFKDKPTDFEDYCAALYRRMGYTAVVTQATNDGGYDITLTKDGGTAIVECKCYHPRHSVGRPLIQKLVGANSTVGADRLIFITTSKFSAQAAEYAQSAGVELVDGAELLRLLREYALLDSDEVVIHVWEWQLNVSDMCAYVPGDIFDRCFYGD